MSLLFHAINNLSCCEGFEVAKFFTQILRRCDQMEMIFHNDICVYLEAVMVL